MKNHKTSSEQTPLSQCSRTIITELTLILTILNLLLYAQISNPTLPTGRQESQTCGEHGRTILNPKLDSLFTLLKTAKHDTTRVNAYVNLCDAYRNSNPDTAMYFADLGLKLATKVNYKKGMSMCYNIIGSIHADQGSYDKAIEYYLKVLKIHEKTGNKIGMSMCYNNIGTVHAYQGGYDKAIKYYIKALKIIEELGDKIGMSNCYGNIGIVHYTQGSYGKALDYCFKALKIKEELGDIKGMSLCYNNIGNVLSDQGDYDKAIEYYLKTLKITEKLGDKNGMSKCYNNIGSVHQDQGDYGKVHPVKRDSLFNKAIEYYLKALKINEELGDKYEIATVCRNIASLNISLADSTVLNKNRRLNYLNKAIEYGTKAIVLAKEINAVPVESDAANSLMQAYKELGDFKKSVEYAEIFITTNDSMFKEEKTKALAGMEAKYQNEKKQLEIDKLGKEKELQLSENKKQKI
ncbi:MAG: tetratricopeptide repeat protein, partial [Bacteroidia bacterium]|nr:tetratricopeptide repeat protein [Bacteroidia bacterium]